MYVSGIFLASWYSEYCLFLIYKYRKNIQEIFLTATLKLKISSELYIFIQNKYETNSITSKSVMFF